MNQVLRIVTPHAKHQELLVTKESMVASEAGKCNNSRFFLNITFFHCYRILPLKMDMVAI